MRRDAMSPSHLLFFENDLPFPNFLNQLVFLHCVFRK